MSIVITGGSGKLGRLTAEAVAAKVSPSEVTLVTRTPDALGGLAARGFVVRTGDFDDPLSLRAAFAGGERLLIISATEIGRRVVQHRAAIDAAVAAGVHWAAYTGIPNPSDSNPGAAARDHRATEEALRESGLAWTFLRNSIYAESLVRGGGPALASGTLVTNAGEGRTSYVSREDCAAAAAAVLTSDGHDGKEYDITGPEALSGADLAALASELSGKPVEAVPVDDATLVGILVEHAGLPEPVAEFIASFGRAGREGQLSTVSNAVEELTGTPPRHFRDVLGALL